MEKSIKDKKSKRSFFSVWWHHDQHSGGTICPGYPDKYGHEVQPNLHNPRAWLRGCDFRIHWRGVTKLVTLITSEHIFILYFSWKSVDINNKQTKSGWEFLLTLSLYRMGSLNYLCATKIRVQKRRLFSCIIDSFLNSDICTKIFFLSCFVHSSY